jgi:hypothetical protein
VIGVLASILLATQHAVQEKGRQRETLGRVKMLELALDNYYADCGLYPTETYQVFGGDMLPVASCIYQLRQWGTRPPYFNDVDIDKKHLYWDKARDGDEAVPESLQILDSWPSTRVNTSKHVDKPYIHFWRAPLLWGAADDKPLTYSSRTDWTTVYQNYKGRTGNRQGYGGYHLWGFGSDGVDDSSGANRQLADFIAYAAHKHFGGDPKSDLARGTTNDGGAGPDDAGIGDDVVNWLAK